MASVTIGETPDPDPEDAAQHIAAWHGSVAGGGLVGVSTMRFSKPVRPTKVLPVEQMVAMVGDPEQLWALVEAGDVYSKVGMLAMDPTRAVGGNSFSQGKKQHMGMYAGAWADLDVKEGSFRDYDHIRDALDAFSSARIGPDIVVGTGSGGAHCYWRSREGMEAAAAKDASEGLVWWLEQRMNVKVDNLFIPTQILRVPGTFRWPKITDVGDLMTPRQVYTIREARDTDWTDFSLLRSVTREAWTARDSARRTHHLEQRSLDNATLLAWSPEFLALGAESDDTWAMRYLRDETRRMHDGSSHGPSWAEILLPAGFEEYGAPSEDGSRVWTRPGEGRKNPRSLVTDWEDGFGAASVFSDSGVCGELARLRDTCGVRLTKSVVAAALYADGNVTDLLMRWRADLMERQVLPPRPTPLTDAETAED